jgi:2-amino-4-hydroxy-6-hydroxymethyldihydropteridine diphosphokinase
MNNAFLLTGGNEADRSFHLKQALANIQKVCGEIIKQSAIYETAAWGKTDQAAFLNQAVLIGTYLSATELMKKIVEIEVQMGRKRTEKYGSRIIDIDILFYNREIISMPGLQIPHPEIQNRRFVLFPLNELDPGFIHPVLQKTVQQLLLECEDKLSVKKL